jgi:hypothetical protein
MHEYFTQRMRERTDYSLVRTEDRYSAHMRVVKSTAQRVEQRARASSVPVSPLLVTGSARASIAALGEETMSRPAGPLERAATAAQRESIALRQDRARVRAVGARQARRRATVATLTAVVAITLWALVPAVGVSVYVAAVATALCGGTVMAGARTASAQRRIDAQVQRVAREVEAAATGTQALHRVSQERASGRDIEPNATETQAIRVLTSEDLAPTAAPASIPSPVVPGREQDSQQWNPPAMPAPAYTLKPSVRQQRARPLSESDYAAAAKAAQERAAEVDPGAQSPSETTGALDAILARRRSASAS